VRHGELTSPGWSAPPLRPDHLARRDIQAVRTPGKVPRGARRAWASIRQSSLRGAQAFAGRGRGEQRVLHAANRLGRRDRSILRYHAQLLTRNGVPVGRAALGRRVEDRDDSRASESVGMRPAISSNMRTRRTKVVSRSPAAGHGDSCGTVGARAACCSTFRMAQSWPTLRYDNDDATAVWHPAATVVPGRSQ
jgi:hypothetical protein